MTLPIGLDSGNTAFSDSLISLYSIRRPHPRPFTCLPGQDLFMLRYYSSNNPFLSFHSSQHYIRSKLLETSSMQLTHASHVTDKQTMELKLNKNGFEKIPCHLLILVWFRQRLSSSYIIILDYPFISLYSIDVPLLLIISSSSLYNQIETNSFFLSFAILCLVQVLLFAFISCASAGRIFILDDGEDGEKPYKISSPRNGYCF